MPLTCRHGHVYAERNIPPVFFISAELRLLHSKFCHASADKLYRLLRRARPVDTTPQTLETLEHISRSYDPCQRIQNTPLRFRVSFGAEDVRFNERIFMDVMY